MLQRKERKKKSSRRKKKRCLDVGVKLVSMILSESCVGLVIKQSA